MGVDVEGVEVVDDGVAGTTESVRDVSSVGIEEIVETAVEDEDSLDDPVKT